MCTYIVKKRDYHIVVVEAVSGWWCWWIVVAVAVIVANGGTAHHLYSHNPHPIHHTPLPLSLQPTTTQDHQPNLYITTHPYVILTW